MKLATVNDRCRAVATFRHISMQLMEMLAAWTPTTPEMEVKVLFGRHIWDLAQQTDALGKRTFELRHPEQYSLAPADEYATLLASARATRPTGDRMATFYEALVPGLVRRFREYVAATDPILDQPTHVILERGIREMERQCAEASQLQAQLGIAGAASHFFELDRAIPSVVKGASV